MLPFVVGAVLALAVAAFATVSGFDRDRAFYPTVLIVVASLYALFAVIGGSMTALGAELIGFVLFFLISLFGFKRTPWLLVAGLIGHGIFDFFHPALIADPGVPPWWPAFCGAYDVVAGVYLAILLKRRSS
jgi:hypothetical protein